MLGSLIAWLFGLLTQWFVWMPIVAFLAYITWRNYRRAAHLDSIEYTLITLEIPKTNDKKELAAEQLFASLHGILRDKKELRKHGGLQEHISFEIAAIGKQILFYVWVPKHLLNFVEGQIYAQYPTVQIRHVEADYTRREVNHPVVYTSELTLTANEMLPIKTFDTFEVDPLAGITGTLAKLESASEEIWIQVLIRPIADSWHRRSTRYINSLRRGGGAFGGEIFGSVGRLLFDFAEAFFKPPEAREGVQKELSERDKTRIAEAEKKSTKLGYQVKIRLAYLGDDAHSAKLRMQAIVGAFKQYNSTNLNGFKMSNASFKREDLAQYTARFFIDKGFILNIQELASVFHLPHTNVETPNIVWASSKTAEPPAKLPLITGRPEIDDNISAFGLTNFRGMQHQFGLNRVDRSRHVYVIGQTGTGKSGLLELFALSDIFHNHGYAIIDPHGDFAVDNMRFIPASRVNDVVYFNPADTAFPMGFNPMEISDPNMRSNISSELIGVMKRMFGDSWGPRLEYILRYTILALLEYPNTTMLDITRMLTDKKFRKKVLAQCTDEVVLNFWKVEFVSWSDKFTTEAISPILNKVGAFTANPIIRNIIGQPKSSFNIRQIMDEGKILIVNLSKGLIGEDNAAVLGSFLVTKVQLAAMSRSDIPKIEDRRPFYLYVDEFQNFATDSFATILSEARKYGLNLTVANQYVSQMQESVRDAVFGNVGTMISFRVSADDAPILAKQFEPQFEANDLLQMHNRHFIINMVINGEKAPAFSATTLTIPPVQSDNSAYIIENTRRQFSRTRAEIETEISRALNPAQGQQTQPAGPSTAQSPAQAQSSGGGATTTTTLPPPPQPQENTIIPADSSITEPSIINNESEATTGKPKRKRSRSRSRRKKKPTETTTPTTEASNDSVSTSPQEQPPQAIPEIPSQQAKSSQSQAPTAPAKDDTEIRLR